MNALRLGLCVLLALVLPALAVAQTTETEVRATAAAGAWLTVMDDARYGEAWDGASSIFRGAVGKDLWVKQAAAVRGPLGRVSSRKAASTAREKNPPGAPPGEYVRIEFDTGFAESSPTRRETVSLFRESDGSWRVAGYFIR
jgi:hypothetical protein